MKRRLVVLLGLCCVLLLSFFVRAVQSDGPKEKESKNPLSEQLPRIPPVEPDKALSTFTLQHGFRLELVAAEPDVADPVDACFDKNGRMYVAEMHGYPYSFERRPQQPEGGGKKDAGIIRLLNDTDGDGRMDRSVVFADRISWPTSVCCYDGGVFVVAPPHVYYFKDTDGDDRADVREIVYSGFSRHNVQGLSNNLKWGLDNRIYFAGGRNGAEVSHRGKKLFSLGRRDLRFNPKTEEIERISGGLQFGHSMDDGGNRFVCSNSNHILHIVLPERYLKRNPYLAVSGTVRSIAREGAAAPVYRRSQAEPWRVVRTRRRANDPKYSKRLPPTELVPTGFFTSATGVTIYRGGAYPSKFRGNAFIGDVGGNLVHRKKLYANDASFTALRADKETEFLASTDNWFRPVNFVNAPDGTLYILDMYRETIEHPVSIPEDIKAHLDLESGDDRGRIYRLVAPDTKRIQPPKLGDASTAELVAQLESPHCWNRQTAQRLLWERQERSADSHLTRLLRESTSSLARLHALWTLEGLDALSDKTLRFALEDPQPLVREHAIRLTEGRVKSGPLAVRLIKLTDDTVYRVRWQLAFSLGEAPPDIAAYALRQLVNKRVDSDMRIAILSSTAQIADQLAIDLMKDGGFTTQTTLIGELLRIVGAQKDEAKLGRLLSYVTSPDLDVATQQQGLRALAEGLSRAGSSLSQALESVDKDVRSRVDTLFEHALETAVDENTEGPQRQAAIATLAFADFERMASAAEKLLSPQTQQSLQIAAIQALGEHADRRVGKRLLSSWRTLTPAVRREAVDVLLGRAGRIESLLSAVEAGTVKLGEIERDKKQLLLNHRQPAIRDRAQELFGGEVNSDRAKVVAEYRKALEQDGDLKRGRELYVKRCSVCHKLGDVGHKVGPELASTKNKSPDDLLIAILDPNREAQPNYTSYTVVTKSGKLVTGMIAAESASSITLRRAEGKQDVVLRSNIEAMASNGVSLMPEGLEKDVNVDQMADLIAFVKSILPEKKK